MLSKRTPERSSTSLLPIFQRANGFLPDIHVSQAIEQEDDGIIYHIQHVTDVDNNNFSVILLDLRVEEFDVIHIQFLVLLLLKVVDTAQSRVFMRPISFALRATLLKAPLPACRQSFKRLTVSFLTSLFPKQ